MLSQGSPETNAASIEVNDELVLVVWEAQKACGTELLFLVLAHKMRLSMYVRRPLYAPGRLNVESTSPAKIQWALAIPKGKLLETCLPLCVRDVVLGMSSEVVGI